MDEKQEQATQESGSLKYYLVGVAVLAVTVGGVYFLRPKSTPVAPATPVSEVQPTPARGPITGLACEDQWYNPVVGFAKYFFGVSGADLAETKSVSCDYTISVAGAVVATTSGQSEMIEAPDRGGVTFDCVSEALALEPEIPTTIDVTVENDAKQTTSCSRTFVLPLP